MKKLTTTILGLFLILIVNAQWYQTYGVTNVNELTKEQCDLALKKANNTIITGQWMTFGGAATSIIGIAIYAASLEKEVNDIWDNDYNVKTGGMTIGAIMAYSGAIVCGIGIPLWISGATQKSQIEIALKKFDVQGTTALGFGFKINF